MVKFGVSINGPHPTSIYLHACSSCSSRPPANRCVLLIALRRSVRCVEMKGVQEKKHPTTSCFEGVNPSLLRGHHWTPIGSARSGVCLCGTCVFVCSKFLLSPLKMSGSSTLLMFHQTTGQSGARSWMHPFLCGDGGGRFEKNCRSSSKRVHPYDQ